VKKNRSSCFSGPAGAPVYEGTEPVGSWQVGREEGEKRLETTTFFSIHINFKISHLAIWFW
jgi:hypothetical protein